MIPFTPSHTHQVHTEATEMNWHRVLYYSIVGTVGGLCAGAVVSLAVWIVSAATFPGPCELLVLNSCRYTPDWVVSGRLVGYTLWMMGVFVLTFLACGAIAKHGPRQWRALKKRAGIQ